MAFELHELVNLPERYMALYAGRVRNVGIENLVLKGKINIPLNLTSLTERLAHLGPQYQRDKFSSLIFSTFTMAVLLFQQKSFLCVGAKGIADVLQFVRHLEQEIKAAAYPNFEILSLEVMNIVVNISVDSEIDVKRFSEDSPVTCTYFQAKFPGARYRPKINGLQTNALVFKSGQINIVGVNTHEDLNAFIDHTLRVIEPYKETASPTLGTPQSPEALLQQPPAVMPSDVFSSGELPEEEEDWIGERMIDAMMMGQVE